ncbi:hypothetical protein BDZ89DRAFT_1078280 [Hymenopellis radicata]|nr:hypothetical protein BDZ89DRAFT_1078280 [Hymenopellis radicata]
MIVAPAALTIVRQLLGCGFGLRLRAGPAAAVFMTAAEQDDDWTAAMHPTDDNA